MAFDEQLERAFDTLTDRLCDEIVRQVRAASDDLTTAARTEDVGRSCSARTETTIAVERLAESVRSIGRASTLGGVLDATLSAAALEASRVCLLLIRGQRFQGWRFLGFGAALDHQHAVDIDPAEAGIIVDAVRTHVLVSGDLAHQVAVPRFGGLRSTKAATPGEQCVAVPLELGGQTVAVLYAEDVISSRDVLDVLANHAARCLESLTTVQAARALTERGQMPIFGAAGPEAADAHAAAQRYARLLVSEIKLYHEAQVATGQRERDLATRLGAQIARARVSYEQHVPAHARHDTDYFDDELVRTLANGDASLLEVRT